MLRAYTDKLTNWRQTGQVDDDAVNFVISGLSFDERADCLRFDGIATAKYQPGTSSSALQRHLAANTATSTCTPNNQPEKK